MAKGEKMKTIIILVLCFGFPMSVFAERGIVVEENIYGETIKMTDGSYIIVERCRGSYLRIGDIVSRIRRHPDPLGLGKFLSPQEITINDFDNNGDVGFYSIEKIDAETGIVVKENIHGEIIKMTDGSYITAERYWGSYLRIGDIVSRIRRHPDPLGLGKFLSPQEITINDFDNNGNVGFYSIEEIDFDPDF